MRLRTYYKIFCVDRVSGTLGTAIKSESKGYHCPEVTSHQSSLLQLTHFEFNSEDAALQYIDSMINQSTDNKNPGAFNYRNQEYVIMKCYRPTVD